MYRKFTVEIPNDHKVTKKRMPNGTTYIYYEYHRKYDAGRKITIPLRNCIGKASSDAPFMMFPNERYYEYFGEDDSRKELFTDRRSSCLRCGNHIMLGRIIRNYGLDRWFKDRFGEKDGGLILDLACYLIVTQDNASQHYPDYAYSHPLFTRQMHVYSDAKICDLLKETIKADDITAFTEWWNRKVGKRNERIYISYDSTNKVSEAGDVEFVESGHSKSGINGEPVFNVSIAMDANEKLPLFYENYLGSIVDISQLRMMIDKAVALGFRHTGFILDRGYFSEDNIRHMDENGCPFLIMVKGRKQLVSSLVLANKGTFENDRRHSIWQYGVNGKTVEARLFSGDKSNRYLHIYYSPEKSTDERKTLELYLQKLGEELEKLKGRDISGMNLSRFAGFFKLTFKEDKSKKIKKLVMFEEDYEKTNRAVELCGYFCIASSEKMDAKKAMLLYKARDASEKLFLSDKTFLGSRTERIYSSGALSSKVFIEFIALIIRSRIYAAISEYVEATRLRRNYLNTVSFISEMEKIELIRIGDGRYHLDHAITATQKVLLSVFGLSFEDIGAECLKLSKELESLDDKSKGENPDEDLRTDPEEE